MSRLFDEMTPRERSELAADIARHNADVERQLQDAPPLSHSDYTQQLQQGQLRRYLENIERQRNVVEARERVRAETRAERERAEEALRLLDREKREQLARLDAEREGLLMSLASRREEPARVLRDLDARVVTAEEKAQRAPVWVALTEAMLRPAPRDADLVAATHPGSVAAQLGQLPDKGRAATGAIGWRG